MKSKRQAKILELITSNEIETQNALTEMLLAAGFDATQATISRDIKELRLVKTQKNGNKNVYAQNVGTNSYGFSDKLLTIFKESVSSYDMAQNIVVIKTLPGLASAACSALDGMHLADLVGTIAGDDTAFILMRTNRDAVAFCEKIAKILE